MNATKRKDREEALAGLREQLNACKAETFPRTLDEQMRYSAPTSPYLHWAENQRIYREHAERMIRSEIEYLEGVPARVAAGELPGWEG